MTAEELVEDLARNFDEQEILARRDGAFDAAVCFQQFAAWHREYTHYRCIRGVDSKTLIANASNGLTILSGDACRDPDALRAIGEHALAYAEEVEAEALLAQAEVTAQVMASAVIELKASLERLRGRGRGP